MPVDHYENFPVASILLPAKLRRPIEAIYRFAREADDIADEGNASDTERLNELGEYRAELDRIAHGERTQRPGFDELAKVIDRWRLPLGLFYDLLDAFAQDVVKTRYKDFPELLHYCRRSANPVGRLLLHLVDCANEGNLRRSDCICTALQLINFWQDIAIDWRKDRIYLPQDDLARFNVDETMFEGTSIASQWRDLLAFQTDRARQLMLEGVPLVRELPGRMAWEIRFTIQGGLRILEAIDRAHGDIFRQRPVLGPTDWLRIGARALRM